jgi:segregation and condensation protein B
MLRPQQHGTAQRRPSTERPGNSPRRIVPLLKSAPEHESQVIDPFGRDPKVARVEAALMMADEPIPLRRLVEAAELSDGREARKLIQRLSELYTADESSFQIVEVAGGFQLHTQPQYHPWLLRLRRTGHEIRLTSAAMETLAVIAYKQPIMRAEIEKVRGVNCAELIRVLLEKGLIRVVGRHDSLGRPQLYGTTKRFLQTFGFNSLSDLPLISNLNAPK